MIDNFHDDAEQIESVHGSWDGSDQGYGEVGELA